MGTAQVFLEMHTFLHGIQRIRASAPVYRSSLGHNALPNSLFVAVNGADFVVLYEHRDKCKNNLTPYFKLD